MTTASSIICSRGLRTSSNCHLQGEDRTLSSSHHQSRIPRSATDCSTVKPDFNYQSFWSAPTHVTKPVQTKLCSTAAVPEGHLSRLEAEQTRKLAPQAAQTEMPGDCRMRSMGRSMDSCRSAIYRVKPGSESVRSGV